MTHSPTTIAQLHRSNTTLCVMVFPSRARGLNGIPANICVLAPGRPASMSATFISFHGGEYGAKDGTTQRQTNAIFDGGTI